MLSSKHIQSSLFDIYAISQEKEEVFFQAKGGVG
jgi:hypothetical protein